MIEISKAFIVETKGLNFDHQIHLLTIITKTIDYFLTKR